MFLLVKIITHLLLPSSLVLLGMGMSLFLFSHNAHRWGRCVLFGVIIFFYLLSIGPIAFLLTESLEMQFTEPDNIYASHAEAIVVLAGGAEKKGEGQPYAELSGTSWKRLWHGMTIWKEFAGALPLVYVGDSGYQVGSGSGEALLAKAYGSAMGVPDEQFIAAVQSRNTFEGGTELRQLLDQRFPHTTLHTIILVTSAIHMPRSVAVMRKDGVQVIPAPADYQRVEAPLHPFNFLPSFEHFSASSASMYEWLGIAGYWVFGRI